VWEARKTSDWQRMLSFARAMPRAAWGKAWTRRLQGEREMRGRLRREKNILDGTCSDTWPKPVADRGAEVFACEGHSVNRKRGEGRVKEPGEDLDIGSVVGGKQRCLGSAPV